MHIGIPFSGGNPRLNKAKASGGCPRFSEEIYRAKLDRIWAQIRKAHLIYRYFVQFFYTPYPKCKVNGKDIGASIVRQSINQACT
ncbi:hypothetical protein J22TS1_23090 [Siminovitchia terrae]|uniref:hypothetical protein n=1 Tax=Siminovitchia terrae TaxID=1914933 RepID=UPI001B1A7D7C|nr:hypothetical protein [Siminovitchia terrae]GIN91258.1 hypothetical protein J22TS1_23090 [Siminovitchia terrae]